MGDIKAVAYAVIVALAMCFAGGFAWLAWAASRATLNKSLGDQAIKQSNHAVKITQQAEQASANAMNSDEELNGALENGTF